MLHWPTLLPPAGEGWDEGAVGLRGAASQRNYGFDSCSRSPDARQRWFLALNPFRAARGGWSGCVVHLGAGCTAFLLLLAGMCARRRSPFHLQPPDRRPNERNQSKGAPAACVPAATPPGNLWCSAHAKGVGRNTEC